MQDVCARADVGRSTFYLHFADKDELLVGGFDDLARAIRATPGTPPLTFAGPLFAHALENRWLFQALVGRRTGQVVLSRFRDVVRDLVNEAVPASPRREVAVRFLAGAFIEVLVGALEGNGATVAELDAAYQAMAASALAFAR